MIAVPRELSPGKTPLVTVKRGPDPVGHVAQGDGHGVGDGGGQGVGQGVGQG